MDNPNLIIEISAEDSPLLRAAKEQGELHTGGFPARLQEWTSDKLRPVNPNLIYASGTTFYFCESHPADGDYVAASYAACNMNWFGQVKGQPCRAGASYGKHFAVQGLYQLAG